MVAIETDDERGGRRFLLRPDFGANWRQTVTLYVVLAVLALTVAVALAVAGFWPVLPFAGLELALLGWALYVSARRGSERQVIWVGPTTVEVQTGHRGPERSWTFERSWTEVRLLRSGHSWYPGRLLLRSRGQELEIGHFLHEEERVWLARELTNCIGPMATSGAGV